MGTREGWALCKGEEEETGCYDIRVGVKNISYERSLVVPFFTL